MKRLAAALALVCALAACSSSGRISVKPTAGGATPSLIPVSSAPQVPDISAFASGWVNSPPLTKADLKGKVVWVDFWDASCINCRRTFPAVRSIYDTYKNDGFTVIGIHSPEFDFEKPLDYVRDNAQRLGVTWPVANDPDQKLFIGFQGDQASWPAQFIVDKEGRVRFFHVGEGDDDQLEDVVRTLLSEGSTTPLPARASASVDAQSGANAITPERYLGAQRGSDTLDQGVVPAGQMVVRKDKTPAPKDDVALTGSFTGADEYLTASVGAQVSLSFTSKEVYAVLQPAVTSSAVEVLLDGKPVPVDQRGPDVTVNSAGQTVVNVTRSDLWHLLTNPTDDASGIRSGVLTLKPLVGALSVSTFTFGT